MTAEPPAITSPKIINDLLTRDDPRHIAMTIASVPAARNRVANGARCLSSIASASARGTDT